MNTLTSEVRDLYRTNPAAKAVFDALKAYERNMTVTTISTLAWRSQQSEQDVKAVCHEFESLKLGRYMMGRWKSPCRFEWAVKITELGAVAAGDQDTLDDEPFELTSQPPTPNSSDGPDDGDGSSDGGIQHSFRLRPDFEVSFKLPVDFSKVEAARVAQFVASLPFND